MQTFLLWVYRTLTYFAPAGILLWTFVIENILNKEVNVITKIGAGGIFILIILLFVCIFFINSAYNKKEKELEKLSIREIDTEKRAEIIHKWEKVEKNHKLFKQCLLLGVVLTVTLLVILLESKILALRGTLISICVSMGLGTLVLGLKGNINEK